MATITVTNLNDSGAGSLRNALEQAEAQAGADEIVFAPGLSGTIRLQSRLTVSTDTVSIDGDNRITISGDTNDSGIADSGDSRILLVDDDGTVSLENLVIEKGFAQAAGVETGSVIDNRGTLSISNSTISDHLVRGVAPGVSGLSLAAPIYNNVNPGVADGGATLTVSNVSFLGNRAYGGASTVATGLGRAATAIYNGGALTLGDITVGGRAYGGDSSIAGRPGGQAAVGVISYIATVTALGGESTITIANDGRLAVGGAPGEGASAGTASFGLVEIAPSAPLSGIVAVALTGTAEREVFYGGAGNDSFLGLGPEDLVSMGAGNDTVSGQGDILLDGEGGNDLLVITGDGDVTVRGDGGEGAGYYGDDTLRFDTAFGVFASLELGSAQRASGLPGLTVSIEQVENLIGSESADRLTGSSFDDNRIEGRGGADQIFGLNGADTLLGGAGNDVLVGDDSLAGVGGDDSLEGGDNDDSLFGVFGDDTLRGGGGNDTLEGGPGANLLDGGAGTDTAVFRNALSDYTLTRNGSTVVIANATETATITGVEQFFFEGTGFRSFAQLFPAPPPPDPTDPPTDPPTEPPTGPPTGPTTGDDLLTGTGGPDRIAALAGADTVRGLGGDDTLLGQQGDDVLRGGGGNDLLKGAAGADRMFGQGADDVLRGGGGDDLMKGGGGADLLIGGGGNDTLHGQKGDDTMKGGGGSDTFLMKPGDGDDVIRGFQHGRDVVEFLNGVSGFGALAIEQQGSDVLVTYARGSILFENQNAGAFGAEDFIF